MKIDPIQLSPDFQIEVRTTDNRGMTPEELEDLCADKIISISDDANPVIRDQAKAFRRRMVKVLEYYMRQAIRSDRTTTYNALVDAGHKDLAELIRRL